MKTKQTSYKKFSFYFHLLLVLLGMVPISAMQISKQMSFIRPDELGVPANGNCLYTSIMLGYLLEVVEKEEDFGTRFRKLVGEQSKLSLSRDMLKAKAYSLAYLRTDFQRFVNAFLRRMDILEGLWGGEKEMREIAAKLEIKIRAFSPDPDNPDEVYEEETIAPRGKPTKVMVMVVRDNPSVEEVSDQKDDPFLQTGKLASLEVSTHRQHYRVRLPDKLWKLLKESYNEDYQEFNDDFIQNEQDETKEGSNLNDGYEEKKNLTCLIIFRCLQFFLLIWNLLGILRGKSNRSRIDLLVKSLS